MTAPASITRVGVLKFEVIESATAAALETALNAFSAQVAARDWRFVSLQYQAFDSSHYSVVIAYTEA